MGSDFTTFVSLILNELTAIMQRSETVSVTWHSWRHFMYWLLWQLQIFLCSFLFFLPLKIFLGVCLWMYHKLVTPEWFPIANCSVFFPCISVFALCGPTSYGFRVMIYEKHFTSQNFTKTHLNVFQYLFSNWITVLNKSIFESF